MLEKYSDDQERDELGPFVAVGSEHGFAVTDKHGMIWRLKMVDERGSSVSVKRDSSWVHTSKDKFEEVRQAVDGQHRAKIAELEVREKKVSDTEAGFAAREALIGPREEAVRKREDEASRIHARIREFTASLSVAS